MKVLFATKNPSKVKYYAKELEKYGFEILTISDLDVEIDVEETGKTGVENAILKVLAYQTETGMITIAIDDNLYFDEFDEERQPGTNVRRVNGKRLSDMEMIEHYTNLVKEHGDKLSARWIKGVAIYDGKDMKTFSYKRESFYFVDKPYEKIHEGYPLDSITVIPKYNKYLSELTDEELEDYKNTSGNKEIFEFMVNTLKEIKEN